MALHMKSSIAAVLMLAGLSLATQAANADALDDITKAGAINVGIFSDFPPFSSA
ncbi:MAG: amino acid ABC transporter substrate-binding protein, partial [Mesorhizobium sp.]